MAINFTIDYASLANAARELDTSNNEYKELRSVLQMVRDNLTSRYAVGQTGAAASTYLEALQGDLDRACAHCQAMSAALTQTLRDIRDQVDPSMASRFQ
jgi:hypothetical protein